MDWKLQLVVLGVTDVDRAKSFYVDRLGLRLDVDHAMGEHFRVVQVTPPGSACSVAFGVGVGAGPPGGVKGLHLVVDDAEAAAAHLDAAGVEHSGLQHFAAGVATPGPDSERRDYQTYIFFDDPDSNGWAIQEVGHPTATHQRRGPDTAVMRTFAARRHH
jgi:catechol 2,3-dioxygenase-like lactoylglutathione lyase family enzyme